MASVLDRYGIKEVADVTFYKIQDNGQPGAPVLYLDTLKVSTIEQTAENVEARGGKGNPALVSWDYNKEINVTLEDALFSAKSMAIMFGNGAVKTTTSSLMKTIAFTGSVVPTTFEGPQGTTYSVPATGVSLYDATNSAVDSTELVDGGKYFATFNVAIEAAYEIEISANTFPGTYYITGDTYCRSDVTGEDEFFQFIIPKAKVNAENTITLEAEGDPSTFNMSLRVLRPTDGKMMRLIKYDITVPNG